MILPLIQIYFVSILFSYVMSFISGALISFLLYYFVKRYQERNNIKDAPVVYSKDLPHNKLIDTVRTFLEKNETIYNYNGEKYTFEIGIPGVKGVHEVTVLFISVRWDSECIKFEILICNMISDSAVSRVIEFVTRLNGIPNISGCYIFNFEDRYCFFSDKLFLMNQPLHDQVFADYIMNLIDHYNWTAKAFSDIATNNHDPLLTYMTLVSRLDHNPNTR